VTNGVTPSRSIWTPAGNGAAALTGSGSSWSRPTAASLVRSEDSSVPPPTPAAAISAGPPSSTPRRPGRNRPDRTCGPSRGDGGGGSGAGERPDPLPTRASTSSRPAATSAATSAGSTASGPGMRTRAAAPETPASATIPTRPIHRCRAAPSPIAAVTSTRTTAMPPSSSGLSAVPKVRTAHSLTGVGAASIAIDPTASSGEAAGTVSAATTCATPIPAAALTTPKPALSHRGTGVCAGSAVTSVVRSRRLSGWVPAHLWP
jgi:hypothetical protein